MIFLPKRTEFLKVQMKNKIDFCSDCKIDTRKNLKDFYMVKDHLWDEFGVGKGMLCMECFEKRLGRKLGPSDLAYCVVNTEVNPYTMFIFARAMLDSK